MHGPGIDEPLVWYVGSSLSTRRNLRPNHQGSIGAVADSAGASVAINSYDDYGIPAATNLGRFAYTGQIVIPELGMYYYKARIYSPTLGRFLQTDPIGYEDQVNLYTYVANDPVNQTDPTGMCPVCGFVVGPCPDFRAHQSPPRQASSPSPLLSVRRPLNGHQECVRLSWTCNGDSDKIA